MQPIPKKWLTRWLLLVAMVIIATTLGRRSFIGERIYIIWAPFYVLLLFIFTRLSPPWAGLVGGTTIAMLYLYYFLMPGNIRPWELDTAIFCFSLPISWFFFGFLIGGEPTHMRILTAIAGIVVGWFLFGYLISSATKRWRTSMKNMKIRSFDHRARKLSIVLRL